jgi:hypothetical protein
MPDYDLYAEDVAARPSANRPALTAASIVNARNRDTEPA